MSNTLLLAVQMDVAWNSPGFNRSALLPLSAAKQKPSRCGAPITISLRIFSSARIVPSVPSPIGKVRGLRWERMTLSDADPTNFPQLPRDWNREETPGAAVRPTVRQGWDHIGGERDAARALVRGEAEAACMMDGDHLLFSQEGVIQSVRPRVLANTPKYDHCNLAVLDGAPGELIDSASRFVCSACLTRIQPFGHCSVSKGRNNGGRTQGYDILSEAVDRFGTVELFVRQVAASCA